MNKTVILIPALNPPKNLVNYVAELQQSGIPDIIIVNDGSSDSFQSIFDRLKNMNCTVLTHSVNMGKGKALKTGFSYFMEHFDPSIYQGIVTADSDGQHQVSDVCTLAQSLNGNVREMLLGCRDFNEPHVPPKSKFGNKLTSAIFRILYRQSISDTQTGLRGFPTAIIPEMIQIDGEAFEYETKMLLYSFQHAISMREIPISTIYFDNNSETHFRPIVDSLKIYRVILSSFFSYLVVSLASFIVDMALFTFFLFVLKQFIEPAKAILIATVTARIVSSLFNFFLNKHFVFGSKGNLPSSMLKYYTLSVMIMLLSGGLTSYIWQLSSISEPLIKAMVDSVLFILTYLVQKKWVFKGDSL